MTDLSNIEPLIKSFLEKLDANKKYSYSELTEIAYELCEPESSNQSDDELDSLINEINTLTINGINVRDIELFYETQTKSMNDSSNSTREKILSNLLTIDKPYTNDGQYGTKWVLLKEEWNKLLKEIAGDTLYDKISVVNLGGRKNNCDYEIKYYNNGAVVLIKDVEFKFNASDITKIPQILQVYEASFKLPTSYSEYYYDNFLKKYLETDNKLKDINIPSKEEYIKYVKTTNYDSNELFRKMYENEETEKSVKSSIVNESIKSYLEIYGKDFNMETFKIYLNKSQVNKIYILWDITNKKFHIDKCLYEPSKDLVISEITNNTIVIKQDTIIFKLLLRWKNHKGILLPAYQVSYKIMNP